MLFAIVHFNTPELTTLLMSSLYKTHPDATVVLFDNSTQLPFMNAGKFPRVTYMDNTKGQHINFSTELAKYPNRYIPEQLQTGSNFGSAKHTITIQYLIDKIQEPFILLDSDILFKKNCADIVDPSVCCVSDIEYSSVNRIYPFIAYINVPLIKISGIKFFDPNRMHGLCHPSNRSYLYDTGASFYEDIIKIHSHKKITYTDYIVHYGNGSWRNDKHGPLGNFGISKLPYQMWAMQHKELWNVTKTV